MFQSRRPSSASSRATASSGSSSRSTSSKAKPSSATPAASQVIFPQVGDLAPWVEEVLDDQGQVFSKGSLQGKTVVLYFYPKDLTSGCTQEACDFKEAWGTLRQLGIPLLGVSKDSIKSHQKFKTQHGLPFPLLSDPEGKLCQAYGVWKEKSMYGRKYMGIERSTFIIGPQGQVLASFRGVKVPGHVKQVLQVLLQQESSTLETPPSVSTPSKASIRSTRRN